MKKAFTLAEIMIVLSVIAIITAILLPAARNATPNEDLMKFKKGHLALVNTIQELVNSDRYYSDGMLDTKPNGQWVDSPTYFCNSFADTIGNVKSVDCKEYKNPSWGDSVGYHLNAQWLDNGSGGIFSSKFIDTTCKEQVVNTGDEITLSNNVTYYTVDSGVYFGIPGHGTSMFRHYKTSEKFYALYKIFCMDIDGTAQNATTTDCVNECPFGYGLRVDGKILYGERASEWFKKSIQEKN